MVSFRPNRPVETTEPVVRVAGNLPPGTYTFRLVVMDNDGNASAPDERTVIVVRGPSVTRPESPTITGPLIRQPLVPPAPVIPRQPTNMPRRPPGTT